MSAGAVRHRFLVAVFVVVAFCPLSLVVEFICESRSRKKRFNVHVIFRPAGRSLVFTRRFVCGPRSRKKDGWLSLLLTLHSGQSYPGTPEQPGSRTGTHPG